WVSLADARACRPSLLLMVISMESMDPGVAVAAVNASVVMFFDFRGCDVILVTVPVTSGGRVYPQHRLPRTGHGTVGNFFERQLAIGHRAQQHRHVGTCEQLDVHAFGTRRIHGTVCDVGRRGAED